MPMCGFSISCIREVLEPSSSRSRNDLNCAVVEKRGVLVVSADHRPTLPATLLLDEVYFKSQGMVRRGATWYGEVRFGMAGTNGSEMGRFHFCRLGTGKIISRKKSPPKRAFIRNGRP